MSISQPTDVARNPADGTDLAAAEIADPIDGIDFSTDAGEPAEAVAEPREHPAIPRNPLLGVIVAALIAFAFATFGLTAHALVVAFAASTLAVLAAIDIEHRVLPNRIVLPAA